MATITGATIIKTLKIHLWWLRRTCVTRTLIGLVTIRLSRVYVKPVATRAVRAIPIEDADKLWEPEKTHREIIPRTSGFG